MTSIGICSSTARTAPFGDSSRQPGHFRLRAQQRTITKFGRLLLLLADYTASQRPASPFSFPGVATSAGHAISFGMARGARRRNMRNRPNLHSQASTATQVNSRVAVGTAIADRPPHRSVRAGLPHTAPPLDTSVKTNIRVGKQGARRRNPPVQDWANLLPGHPRLLTPTA